MSDPQAALTRIGRYRLVRRLGAGAFATVWLATDEALDIEVAIKVLADNWSFNDDVRDRFLAEARLLRRISSPRVVRVHDVGEIDQRPYFVMDLIDGGTLADVTSSEIDAAERLRLGAEAAYAVHELHLAGVAHRDIKPANLLLDHTSTPTRLLVADLGTAKLLADGTAFTMTAGTPAYMAPEQVYGTGGIDARADVYSVGVVTYELLSGRRPYEVTHIMALTERGDERPAAIARELGLPDAVDEVLAAALSRDPSGRPADAAELGDVLADLATDAGASATLRAPSKNAPAWAMWAVAIAMVTAFAGAAAATWLLLT